MHAAIQAVRRFSRFYTRQIGLLREGLHDSRFSLTEVRVLYELAHRDYCTASLLRRELGLDAGYMSRILSGFEKKKLLRKNACEEDGRQTLLSLTAQGRRVIAGLEEASDREAARLVQTLSESSQAKLIAAMESIEALLNPAAEQSAAFVLRSHEPGDLGWMVSRHGALYAQEYGLDENFEALVAEIAAHFLRHHDARRERCWIAERSGERVGSVMLVREADEIAKLRVLLVEPSARGLGIGRALVEECIRFAKQAGYSKIVLWTSDVLTAARRIYEEAGFRLVAEERHRMFGPEWIGQTWELPLGTARGEVASGG
jgi:DNA-binding MarR family transcriptional regulator/GNAT superfamily N-acetyltransferase